MSPKHPVFKPPESSGVRAAARSQIAEGAKGNIRAALADLEMWIG